MADPKNDDPVVTTKSAKKGAATEDAGREAVTLEGPGGTTVTAPKRSVDRLKSMGFK